MVQILTYTGTTVGGGRSRKAEGLHNLLERVMPNRKGRGRPAGEPLDDTIALINPIGMADLRL